jgi:hypothetical protein
VIRRVSPPRAIYKAVDANLISSDEPTLSISKNGMIATRTGAFTDHWKKID